MQRSQINYYCNDNIKRLDIDVLARICIVSEFEIDDLPESILPQRESKSAAAGVLRSVESLFTSSVCRLHGKHTVCTPFPVLRLK